MKSMRMWLPWRLKLKRLIVLLCVSLVLLLLGLLMMGGFGHVPQALKNARQPVGSHYLAGEDLNEDEFMHLERLWKEPQWEMADVLRRAGKARNSQLLPVIVVEEHHEVLKYWFDAVEAGVLPKAGNTLLHIDGHSDAAPPRDLSLVPWFRLPRNHSEVSKMMQSNDVFIAGAALAGLISRYIWVWPDWDMEEHTEDLYHSVDKVKAGWMTYYPVAGGDPVNRHCVCLRALHANFSEVEDEDWECWDDAQGLSQRGQGGDSFPHSVIKSTECHAVTTAIIEKVHESKALELLKAGDWIQSDEKLLLDIDEDYYGCESSVMPLYNVNLTQVSIDKLSDLVLKFMCVNDVHTESIADKVFRTLVGVVQDFKANLCGKDKKKTNQAGCVSEFEADRELIQIIPKLSETLRRAGMAELLCNGKASELMLQIILRTLFKLNPQQLDALHYVGVCLPTAPSSFMFEPNNLHVCHGFNVPSNTEVTFHVPTARENAVRSGILRSSLSLLPQPPRLVTVCRSMRDGYTPWRYFRNIERSVLDILRSKFSGVTRESFHYDENLLGGKNGWPDRDRF